MPKVNKHGLKINRLKQAAGNTGGIFRGYVQIAYDTDDGNVYTRYHASLGNWTEWEDPNVITVKGTQKRMTMQEIADAVYYAVVNRGLYL